MDYKEKYKHALERASKLRVHNPFDTVGQMVEHIFPELKESEDDSIRNGLIALLKFGLEDNSAIAPGFNVTKEQALAWIEKQGEQKPIDYNEELKKCLENPLYFFDKYVSVKLKNQKPALGKDDESIRKEIIDFLGLPHPQFVGKRDHEKWIDWLEKQKDACDREYVFRPVAGDTIEKAAERAVELDGKVVLAFNGAYIPVGNKTKDEIVAEYRNWIEKQSEQKTVEMNYRNNDISACESKNCPMHTTCLRWIIGQQRIENYQWFGKFEPTNGGCEFYIHNKPINDNDNENN